MATKNSVRLKRSAAAIILSASVALTLTTATPGAIGNRPAVNKPFLAGSDVPAPVRAVLDRACRDCHSANTDWPWYASIPPVSWRIHSDVDKARAFLDFSKWNQYSEDERQAFATAIETSTRTKLMPPSEYLWIHRGARLSGAEMQLLQAWAAGGRESANRVARDR